MMQRGPGPSTRDSAVDACPGALRPHLAADGGLVRLRLPGGWIESQALGELAALAERFGDGALHLTSRGNVQLRGLRLVDGWTDPVLVQEIRRIGLLPAPSHELVRNVLASPPLAGGSADVQPVVRALDAAICADPALARLPGRFLFAVDDGRGDVVGAGADVGWWADGPGAGTVVLAGRDTGLRIGAVRVATAITVAAQAFLRSRDQLASPPWRLAELGGAGVAVVTEAIRSAVLHTEAAVRAVPPPADGLARLGVVDGAGGSHAVAALVPLGRLTSFAARTLASAGGAAVVVTPWREVLLTGLSDVQARRAMHALEALPRNAVTVSDDSGWRGVSACAGRPGCARARADVRSLATDLANARVPGDGRVHLSGCERRCGRPAGPHREIVMTPEGLVDQLASTEQNGSE